MYEALLKATPEYQKIAASLAAPGPAALFGLPPAGRALLYAALQKDLGRVLCIVTPGEAEATHFAEDLKALGLTAAVFPPRDFMLRPVEGAGREYEYRRLSVLGQLAGGRLNAVCVPAEALLQYTVQTIPLNPPLRRGTCFGRPVRQGAILPLDAPNTRILNPNAPTGACNTPHRQSP